MPGIKQGGRTLFHDARLYYLYVSNLKGSMRAAADELNVAPSSISRQISLLEKDLKVQCIEKGSHRIKLTNAGSALLEYYEKRLRDQEHLFEHIDDLREQAAGTVWVAMSASTAAASLFADIADYGLHKPGCKANLLVRRSREVCQLVLDDTVHFGLVAGHVENVRLRVVKALDTPIRALVAPGHPLAGRGLVKLTELARYPRIHGGSGFATTDMMEAALVEQGLDPSPALSCESAPGMAAVLQRSQTVGLSLGMPFEADLAAGRLVALDLGPDDIPPCPVSLVCRTGRRLPDHAIALMRRLQRMLDSLVRPHTPMS